MTSYAKLVGDILTSSVWQLDSDTRIVWITILALKDKDGFVSASLPGLAHTARVTREACEKAVALFEAADPDSRTPDNDGRRIEKVSGGWIVLNHWVYRGHLSTDPETVQARERMRKFRAKHATVTERNVTESCVTVSNPASVSASVSVPDSERGMQGGQPGSPSAFDAFWTAWPTHKRKTDRKGCLRIWQGGKLDGQAADIMAGLAAWVASADWHKDGGEYIPAPIVWLRREGWTAAGALTPHGVDADPDKAAWTRTRDAVADLVWNAREQMGDVTVAMQAARDKYRGAPKLNRVDPITSGIEFALNNERAKRV